MIAILTYLGSLRIRDFYYQPSMPVHCNLVHLVAEDDATIKFPVKFTVRHLQAVCNPEARHDVDGGGVAAEGAPYSTMRSK
ncbi:unnamed protein product [Clonostachys rosea f. rosea IK726]|uniref:Uncharacterized protein n=1 Tax=Clonostachys rosea f. rosea IK726 TaxID=1349383 RepID=A0ACA9UMV4_BIOOC|nr:unnamed protein product [Clonostachys rosea f. rosea IK726]